MVDSIAKSRPLVTFREPRIPSLGEQLAEQPTTRRALSFLLGRHTPHWCRVVMNRETRRWVDELTPSTLDALEISGEDWRGQPFKSYRSAAYPDYDLCARPLAEAAWDLVIAEQVLEHVESPRRALESAHRMLRPGGRVLVTTPFLIRYHEAPLDCWRWTHTGLELMLEAAGFESVISGSWGNRACVVANLERWVKYRPLRHSLRNDARVPIVVWALARRGTAGSDDQA